MFENYSFAILEIFVNFAVKTEKLCIALILFRPYGAIKEEVCAFRKIRLEC